MKKRNRNRWMVEYYTEQGLYKTLFYETYEEAQSKADQWWYERTGKGSYYITEITGPMKIYKIKLEMFNDDIINIKGKYTYDEASMLASAHIKDNLVKNVRLYVGRELRETVSRLPVLK